MKIIYCFLLVLVLPLSLYSQEYNEDITYLLDPSITDAEIGSQRDEQTRIYNTLNPYYAEVCTATQYLPLVERANNGGTGGHATVFLNGACLDESKPYPYLKMCDDSVDLTDPNTSGVGVSLNLMFANVRFIAIPGRDNFMKGPAEWGEMITPEVVERTRQYYLQQPWFDGIELASEQTKDCTCKADQCTKPELKKCLIDKNTGIDFAITFARSSYCARLPMPKQALAKVVESLNVQNTDAYLKSKNGERGYTYDVIVDNCSHLIHNAIAATGFFDAKAKVKSTWYSKIWGPISEIAADLDANIISGGEFGLMSVPVHNINRIAKRSIDLKINDIDEMYKNDSLNKMIFNYNWIPAGSGSMVSVTRQRRNSTAFEEGEVGVSFFFGEEEFEQFMDPTDTDHKTYYSNLCESLSHKKKLHKKAILNAYKWDNTMFKRKLSSEKRQFIEAYKDSLLTSLSKINHDINITETLCR